jgi:hypothetical protein
MRRSRIGRLGRPLDAAARGSWGVFLACGSRVPPFDDGLSFSTPRCARGEFASTLAFAVHIRALAGDAAGIEFRSGRDADSSFGRRRLRGGLLHG